MAFLILPIHLFKIEILLDSINKQNETNENNKSNPITHIYILEEPAYFGKHYMDMNYNKLKLIYHRATLKYYYDYLESNLSKSRSKDTHIKLEYIDYKTLSKARNSGYARIKKHDSISLYNPIDTFLDTKYKRMFGAKLQSYLETPLFLCSSKDLEDYNKTKKTKDSYYHASFYTWQRSRMGILAGSRTYDTENRNMMPLEVHVPPLPANDSTTMATKKYLAEAITYVQSNWSRNLEPVYVQQKERQITPESIHFPITHSTAIEWVHHFCKHRFHLFGKYEDSIDSVPRNFLFHSCITPMLNIGLITPQEVVDIITKYYKAHTKEIGIANYEGFIRQIIGWREYQRYIYQYAGDKMRSSNHFGNSRRLNDTWYSASTGLKPVDDAVKLALDDGYIHHILRLMVVGNFMNLVGIHPDDVYKWFMEFALDSYDWVMVGNVYSMALWADGGLTMRKPYISGDGYIMKMSNYSSKVKNDNKKTKKNILPEKEQNKEEHKQDTVNKESWNTIWNAVFHDFINRNASKLLKTYYAGLVRAWHKKTEKERTDELAIAKNLISKISS
jgi:deoxyribodipyrimidine photolyase-related protein